MASRRAKDSSVLSPNLGLYLGIPALTVPLRGLQDGFNFRIKNGRLSNLNLGWTPTTLFENDANTKVLLHFNGADAVAFTDEGAFGGSNRLWTFAGNAQLDTAIKKFGSAALLLDGTGDWITTPDHADFTLGSGDFTVALWFNCNVAGGTTEHLCGQTDAAFSATATSFGMDRHTTNVIRGFAVVGTNFFIVTGTTQFTNAVNTGWHHAAFVRTGNVLKLFIDGVQEGGNVAITGTVNNSANALRVGAVGEVTTTTWTGWIDEFSLSVGVARYTANFAPPTAEAKRVLSGPVLLQETFKIRTGAEFRISATTLDLYQYNLATDRFFFINPAYITATVNVSAANPAVVTANTGAPLWVTNGIKAGDKIHFRSTTQNDPDADWYTVAVVNGESTLTLTGPVIMGALTNVAYTIRRVFTGDELDVWDSATFVAPDDGTGDDLFFVTNGVEAVSTWDGLATFAIRRPSLGFIAKRLTVFKNTMIYSNLVTSGGEALPTSFINSDIGKPLDVVLGLAAQFKVHDGVDPIKEVLDLGDNLVFYSERHVTQIQFVGDPLIFVFRNAAAGTGVIASRLVADFGDYHLFIGHDSQYLFDGVSVTEVGKQVWREVLRTRDATRHEAGFHHFDEENGDLLWIVALTSDAGVGVPTAHADVAFVEHYLEEVGERVPNPISKRSFPFYSSGYSTTSGVVTWNELTEPWEDLVFRWNDSFLFAAFPLNIAGDGGGRVFTFNVSQTANGVDLPSNVRFGRRLLGDGRSRGLLTRLYAFATQLTGPLSVTTRYADHAAGPATITDTKSFDTMLVEGGHFVTPYRRGRYFDAEFSTPGHGWEVAGYDIDARQGGRR